MLYTETVAPRRGGGPSGPETDVGVLLIPGRVPKHGSVAWPRWRDELRSVMANAITQPFGEARILHLRAICYYGSDGQYTTPTEWADRLAVPQIATLTETLFVALLNHLYIRRAQVNSLTIERHICLEQELQAQFGPGWSRGGLRLEYEAT
ncbi:MAG: hypothetical protein IVW51_18035 [Thermaceae bacterium]|nr:hypothetical protein [Thermaceae bacterium]